MVIVFLLGSIVGLGASPLLYPHHGGVWDMLAGSHNWTDDPDLTGLTELLLSGTARPNHPGSPCALMVGVDGFLSVQNCKMDQVELVKGKGERGI